MRTRSITRGSPRYARRHVLLEPGEVRCEGDAPLRGLFLSTQTLDRRAQLSLAIEGHHQDPSGPTTIAVSRRPGATTGASERMRLPESSDTPANVADRLPAADVAPPRSQRHGPDVPGALHDGIIDGHVGKGLPGGAGAIRILLPETFPVLAHGVHEAGRHPARLGQEARRPEDEDAGVPIVPSRFKKRPSLGEVRLLGETRDVITVGYLRAFDFKITEFGVGPRGRHREDDDGRRVTEPGRGVHRRPEGLRVRHSVVRRDRGGDRVAIRLEVERASKDGGRGIAAEGLEEDPLGRDVGQLLADERRVGLGGRYEDLGRERRDPVARVREQAPGRDERQELLGPRRRRERPQAGSAAPREKKDAHPSLPSYSHFRPRNSTSGERVTPNFSRRRRASARIRRTTSADCAPPRLTITFAWRVEIAASPLRSPLRPHASTRRPA